MKTIVLVLFGVCAIHLSARTQSVKQNETSPNTDNQQIQVLEKKFGELKEELEKTKKEQAELKTTVEEYESFYKNWKWIAGFFGIVGFGALMWMLYKYIPKKVNTEVDKVIDSLVKDRRDQFMAVLKEFDWEQQLKKKHKLIMITHRNGSDTYHFDLLTKHGFSVTPLTNIEKLDNATLTQEDVVIINNEGDHWQPEDIEVFINRIPNYCFYIGKGIIKTNGSSANRFAAANIRTQFIVNLVNTLKYQNIK